jgi:hypothetical protein
MKVFKTNWISVVGVFISVFLFAIFLNLNDLNVSRNLFQSIIPSLILVVAYGCMFWIVFFILLLILDLFFIAKGRYMSLMARLLVEWAIISGPFIYWAIRYQEWIFVAAVLAFLITQFLRQRQIARLIKE